MLRTYVYVPDELGDKIHRVMRSRRVSKARVIRGAQEKGLRTEDKEKSKAFVDVMFKLAELGKKFKVRGLKDASKNMDRYLWDKMVYPVTAILEAGAFIQRVLGDNGLPQAVMGLFLSPHLMVCGVSYEDLGRAVRNYFTTLGCKKNTIFDCIVAAVADKYGTREIFSFDSFYKKRGFHFVKEE